MNKLEFVFKIDDICVNLFPREVLHLEMLLRWRVYY